MLRDCYEYDGVVLARAAAQISQAEQRSAYHNNTGRDSTATLLTAIKLPILAIGTLNSLLVDIWATDEQNQAEAVEDRCLWLNCYDS